MSLSAQTDLRGQTNTIHLAIQYLHTTSGLLTTHQQFPQNCHHLLGEDLQLMVLLFYILVRP